MVVWADFISRTGNEPSSDCYYRPGSTGAGIGRGTLEMGGRSLPRRKVRCHGKAYIPIGRRAMNSTVGDETWRQFADPHGRFRVEIPAFWRVEQFEGTFTRGHQGRVWEGHSFY